MFVGSCVLVPSHPAVVYCIHVHNKLVALSSSIKVRVMQNSLIQNFFLWYVFVGSCVLLPSTVIQWYTACRLKGNLTHNRLLALSSSTKAACFCGCQQKALTSIDPLFIQYMCVTTLDSSTTSEGTIDVYSRAQLAATRQTSLSHWMSL